MRQRAETPATLAGVDAARNFFGDCVDPLLGQETLWVAHLDDEARCLRLAAYPGCAGSAEPPVGSILGDAARLGSSGLILAHRQSGPTSHPRWSDRTATARLAEAADAIDVALVDHLVFAGEDCTSMRRLGLL